MTKKETIEAIKVMQAYADGKEVEWKYPRDDEWHPADGTPVWNWLNCDYHIKPEPKIRPWTAEEGLGQRVAPKGDAIESPFLVGIWRKGRGEELLRDCVQFPSGKPCGVEVTE